MEKLEHVCCLTRTRDLVNAVYTVDVLYNNSS